ncbi:MAG: hypothetical protein MRY63_03505 [Neomegalonema sp.]|nr:hypothetical protein [Neomegalonema sp.]
MGQIALLRAGRAEGRAVTGLPLLAPGAIDSAAQEAIEGWFLPPPWDRARLLASPGPATLETAQILAAGRRVETDHRLLAWRSPLDDAKSPDLQSRTPPTAEAPQAILIRLRPLLTALAEREAPTLVIAPVAVARAIIAAAHDWDHRGSPPFRLRRGELHPLSLTSQGTPYPAGAPILLMPREP